VKKFHLKDKFFLKNNFELSSITTYFQQNNFVSVYFAYFGYKSYNASSFFLDAPVPILEIINVMPRQ